MRLLARFLSCIKAYPYRERLPFAAIMLCLIAWISHTSRQHDTGVGRDVDRVVTIALCLAVFCGHRARPFWFFWGMVVGAGLVAALPWLYTILGH